MAEADELLVDRVALERHLREQLPDLPEAPVEVERLRAGHSNETFFVTCGDRRWVLRRPPRGAFLPTAHDVGREYRVLAALAGTPVRAPRPVLWCPDETVIGAPFYLMERIHGLVVREELPAVLATEPERRGVGEELVDALVELHAVDPREAGLEGFGRPDGYLERQVRRWRGQLALTEPLTRPLPDLHVTADWLEAHVPPTREAAVVHGDYKLDNVLFAPEVPARLVAILDWEMSTLGDPRADLGWMLSFWREPGESVEPGLDEGAVTAQAGFAARDELVRRYEARSGRTVGDLTFHLALAAWKLAILLEGSYARHLAGLTDDPFFDRLRDGVPALARRARALTRT
jgi:aminoglycoside phosphotransferase (APT) family kinase protein